MSEAVCAGSVPPAIAGWVEASAEPRIDQIRVQFGKPRGNKVSTACDSGLGRGFSRAVSVWYSPSTMWNDTDTPLAYFISFRGYGTWLHGDARGSTDRYHNQYGAPHIPQIDDWHKHNENQLKSPPVRLDASRRQAVREAIVECCEKRGWHLLAMNIRTNHVHTVVDIGAKKVGLALNALKANATRQLKENGLWTYEHSPWARKGSRRHLWTEKHVAGAIDYVLNGQGDDLPNFE